MSLSYVDPAVTAAEADAYAQPRGWSDWAAASSGDKDAALRRGQDFIAGTYNGRWTDEWENDAAPADVKYAIIEAARRELAAPGSLDPDVTPGKIKERVKVEGAVEVAYAVGKGDAASQRPVIGIIDGLLAPYLPAAAGASISLLRA